MPLTANTKPPTGRKTTRRKQRRLEREAKKTKRVASQRDRGQNTDPAASSYPRRNAPRGNTDTCLEAHPDAASTRPGKSTITKQEEGGGRKRPLTRGRHEREKMRERRRQRPLLTAEEREVSRLEKMLKMKKRKNLPTAFREDGLDYLLNLTDGFGDRGNRGNGESSEEGIESGMSSGDEPLETETRSHKGRGKRERAHSETETKVSHAKVRKIDDKNTAGKEVWFGAEEGGDSESDESNVCEFGDSGEDGGSGGEEGESEVEEERDSDGYVDTSGDSKYDSTEEQCAGEREGEEEGERGSRYLPPHARGLGKSLQRTPRMEKLQKTMQGLVNRLNESNLQSIAMQLEQMYTENSRNDMNHCLTEVLLKACVSPAMLSERFAMLHVMLVAILHNNIGSEVGAYVIQKLVQRFNSLLSQPPNYGRGKECDCLLLLIATLYTFKVIHCVLIYDIIRKLAGSFTERDIELLLLLLKNTGMEIRKDDATSLKDIILLIQSRTASSAFVRDSYRTRFMLETINALKTNNSRKIPNHDPSLLGHMRRLMRGLVHSRGPADENQLKISLQDLLMTDQQGRWWVVGSAWTGREATTSATTSGGGVSRMAVESWVLDLARKQRMNTDVRKNVFCVLVTSEDCVDAFEKLLRLGLKDKQEREIIRVIIDCCLQEKTFNPYYALLGQKFCEFSRTHQVTFQYSLWDRLKALLDMTLFGRSNLRQLLVHLVTSQALSLAVLRVVEFTELGKVEEKFYRKLLHTLLVNCNEEICKAVFSRLTVQPHLKPFQDSLLLFMKHHLLLPHPTSPSHPHSLPTKDRALQTKLQLVEHIMSSPHSMV